jgi:parallel beta-helix repeat protein
MADRATATSEVDTGNTDYFAGSYASAEANFTAAIAADATWALPFNNRGLARFHQGNFAGADADFDVAKGMDTNYASPCVNKGKSLTAQRRFSEAVAELQAGLALTTNNAGLYFNLAWAYDEQELYSQAISNYTAALGLNSSYQRARLGRGVSYAKQGAASNAITDFYAVINDAPSGDMLTAIAAYDLQLLRGPGLNFNTDNGATNFINGLFSYSTEQYGVALTNLSKAQTTEPGLADIPWMTSWSYIGNRDTNSANVALAQAYNLMEPLTVRSIGNPADIFIDGIKRGTTPSKLYLFSNGYDITLRRIASSTNQQEWVGITYTDGTPGGSNGMLLNPTTVTNFTRFGPVADTDRDWLADAWEMRWFGNVTKGPQGDEDHDGVSNLQEFWASTDPTKADTDGDGFSDFTEIFILGTDPTVPNRFYYVNDGSTNNDEWCTAPGNDSNDGLTPATPKASVQAIVDGYTLTPGDVVLIDTGTYNLASNIRVTGTDSGSSDAPVTFMASPYGVTLNRGNTGDGNYVWDLNGANYVTLTTATGTRHPELAQSWMKSSQGYNGICLQNATACRVSRCEAVSNFYSGVFIGSCAAVTVENSVSRGCMDPNGGDGIRVEGGSGITVRNCTIYGNTRVGMSFANSSGYTAINNVVCQDGAANPVFWFYNSSPSQSDYNNCWATGGAVIGHVYYGADYATLADWKAFTGVETHSLSRDPLFVGATNGDFHLQSTAGSYHGGSWLGDLANSPCVDAGQPTSAASNEPVPNGNRVNLGAFGNTAQASKTPAGRMLTLLSPAGNELWQGSESVLWLATGKGWGSNDTVRLEYSVNHGSSWTLIAGASALPYAAGGFAWDTTTVPSSPACLVRVAYNGAPSVQDVSSAVFVIHNTAISYYVNDGSRSNDVYCTAVGSDLNDGLSPGTPKASVQAILDNYVLQPGDVVWVDAGMYNLTNNITLTSADSGSGTNYVRIVGARHPATGALTTWINRNSRASGAACFQIASGDGYSVEQMRLTGSADGVDIPPDGNHRLLGLEIVDNTGWGVNVGWNNENLLVDHCLLWNNGGGVYHSGYGSLTVRSCTIVQDQGTGVGWAYSTAVLSNNIVVASGAGSRCLDWSYWNSVASDYNDLYAEWGGQLSGSYGTLAAWRAGTGQDGHSLSLDPLFVDQWDGDYHLQSTAGSWHGGAWLADATDSPCIDAGDPLASPGAEPSPNGGRLNLGAFGGTAQASKTLAGQTLALLAPLGGELWRGTNSIVWLATGQGWASNDTVRLEYSVNHGASWLAIAGASALQYGAGGFAWDTTTVPSGAGYLLLLTCNRTPSLFDTTKAGFTIHNSSLTYYVNDGSLSNDVYCTAVGNDGNDGLSPGTPKASVQAILDNCVLQPGDLVLVDAGVYNLTNNTTLTSADSGSGTNYVRIVGARHPVTGALTTSINRNSRASGAACFQIASGDGYSLEQMRLSGSADGVDISPDGTHRLMGLEIMDNTGWGVNVGWNGENLLVDHCLLWNNGGGVYHSGYGSVTVRSCTIVQDQGTGVGWAYSTAVLSNNIVVASGAGSRCLDWSSLGPVASDYNDLYAEWGGQLSGSYGSLAAWRAGTGQETHSLSLDPLFVDQWDGDYHLQSTAGSWHGGAWLADATDSPCIDAGDPLASPGAEPSPNGGRLNLGAFGGTAQASKTLAGQTLALLAPLGGELWRGTNSIVWLATGQGWASNDTVRLEYSVNHGASWLAIAGASALQYGAGGFAWDTTTVPSGAGYLLLLTCNRTPSLFDTTKAGFTIHNSSLTYYVNDGSLSNDVYCTAVGNDGNDGLSPGTPKASVQAILDNCVLQPGDLVLVDAGVYNLTNNTTLTSADSGSGTNYVRIVGARHPVTGALTTSINRNSRASGAACFQIASGDGYSLEQMRLSGSADGVDISPDGTHRLMGLEIMDNTGWGVNVGWNGENLLVDHCLLWNNGGGVYHSGYGSVTVRSCTIVQDQGTGVGWDYSTAVLSNNIVVASGAGSRCLDGASLSSVASDYNDLYADWGGQLSGSYGSLAAWCAGTGQDGHSLSLDPLFVDAGDGDYHLQSTGGSWHGGAWLADATDSPCIDAGAPASDYSQEPFWNGGKINLGAYGNTPQASKSGLRVFCTVSGTNLVLSFPSVQNKNYLFEYCDDVRLPSWSPWSGGTLSGNGSNLVNIVPIDRSIPKRFYRIRLVP